jgi:hypothetical protein
MPGASPAGRAAGGLPIVAVTVTPGRGRALGGALKAYVTTVSGWPPLRQAVTGAGGRGAAL